MMTMAMVLGGKREINAKNEKEGQKKRHERARSKGVVRNIEDNHGKVVL